MEAVVPHAKFVTIIRDPVGQFESAFGYFEMASNLGISKKPDPLAVFLKHPANYYKKSFHMKVQSWNGQLFDLGLNHSYCSDTSKVAKHITKLDKELDLVMLTEYFDESLILLRKLMCWSYEQILYLPKGVRNDAHRYSVSAQIAEEIREWNAADVQLYRHFNKTFWRKVNEYGPDFESDLQEFRQLQQKMLHMCIDTDKEGWGDYRETQFAHKKNAPKICDDLVRTDIEFVQLIRWKEMENEFGLAKLLGMIAGGIILIIVVMTGILVLISRVVQWFCRTGEKTGLQSNYKYAKLNQNSEIL
ncbi:galactosylceramide sulfotransferase-like isoform X1 [Amphiura filiformis]|uniref:galactosylceramide sulfotransferase-like isoform X1 n=1 Tax=Amphiura filiformis TaxID=82378 RepID=UPI003B21E18B